MGLDMGIFAPLELMGAADEQRVMDAVGTELKHVGCVWLTLPVPTVDSGSSWTLERPEYGSLLVLYSIDFLTWRPLAGTRCRSTFSLRLSTPRTTRVWDMRRGVWTVEEPHGTLVLYLICTYHVRYCT
jgi:hypothetical protein